MGPFNNYVTLKLPFFDQPTTCHHTSSQMITRLPLLLRYFTPDTDPPFIIYSLFLKLKKKIKIQQSYTPTHDTSTQVFQELNQIVRFK